MAHTDVPAEPQAHESNAEDSLLRPGGRRKGRAERMWKPIRLRLTEKYQYITHNVLLVILHYIFTFAAFPAIYLVLFIRWGFRMRGREHLRSVRGRAAVTVSNHIHDVDSLMVTAPLWPATPYIIARKHNLEVFLLGIFNRAMRAVPLPEDLNNFRHFTKAINKLLSTTKHKLHVFPEGEILPYATELRKFGNGAFHFAVVNNVPIVPMVFVSPGPERLELEIGAPIELKDVPGMGDDLRESRKTRLLSDYTKKRMQEMLDSYYAAHAGGSSKSGTSR